MDVITTAVLVGTGVVAGIIAAMVGGAAVVIYPALIATGVSPQLAAVSNLASVMPATMLAALSDRSQLPPFNRAFIGLIIASVVGAGAGAALLLLTPERMFAQIVPLLIGFATLLFAYAERITRWLRARAEGRGHDITFNLASLKVVLPVSFYGGYFGRPYWSRYGYYGYRSPFYWGWDDPFWYNSPYSGFGGDPIREYTVYKSQLDLDIVRRVDNQPLFDGRAVARSQTDELGTLVPNLIEAMFTNFPGENGKTVKITVPGRKRT